VRMLVHGTINHGGNYSPRRRPHSTSYFGETPASAAIANGERGPLRIASCLGAASPRPCRAGDNCIITR